MDYIVPTEIETERLKLRQFRESDWKDLHAYYSDREATQYTVGRAFTEGDTWRTLCSMIGHWQIRGYGPYAVEEKQSEKVIGVAGFWYPIDWPSPEIKWALTREHWGKGFAQEAARAVQKVGRKHLPDVSLISLIHAENFPSQKLAMAVGATLEREMEFRDAVFQVYRHPSKT